MKNLRANVSKAVQIVYLVTVEIREGYREMYSPGYRWDPLRRFHWYRFQSILMTITVISHSQQKKKNINLIRRGSVANTYIRCPKLCLYLEVGGI